MTHNQIEYGFLQSALLRLASLAYQKANAGDGGDEDTPAADEPKTGTEKPTSDSAFTQADIDRVVKERTGRYLKQVSELQRQIEELTGKVSEHDAAKEAARQKELEEQGKYQELLEETKTKHAKELGERDATITQLRNSIHSLQLDHALDAAIQAQPNVISRMTPHIKRILREGTPIGEDMTLKVTGEVDPETGAYQPIVTNADGTRLTNGKGAFMSIGEGLNRFLEAWPEFVQAQNRRGSGANNTGQPVHQQQQLEQLAEAAKSGRDADVLAYYKAQKEANSR